MFEIFLFFLAVSTLAVLTGFAVGWIANNHVSGKNGLQNIALVILVLTVFMFSFYNITNYAMIKNMCNQTYSQLYKECKK